MEVIIDGVRYAPVKDEPKKATLKEIYDSIGQAIDQKVEGVIAKFEQQQAAEIAIAFDKEQQKNDDLSVLHHIAAMDSLSMQEARRRQAMGSLNGFLAPGGLGSLAGLAGFYLEGMK